MDYFTQDDDAGALVDINTTPLIDVLLVLLIMLIVTIPATGRQVDTVLPDGAATVRPVPEAVRIDVAADGTLRWAGEPLADMAALESRLHPLAAMTAPRPDIHLHAAPQAAYGRVVAVMAAVQRQSGLALSIVE